MSDGKSAWELVPEVYFDLIARIVPGSMSLVVVLLKYDVEGRLPDLGSLGSVLIGLLLAYGVGLTLDVIGDTVTDALTVVWNRITPKPILRNLDICRAIDRVEDRSLASVLTKLMAEKALVRSLALVSLALLAVPPRPSAIVPWWVAATAAFVFVALVIRLEHHLRTRVTAHPVPPGP